jgi:hypothetical protein
MSTAAEADAGTVFYHMLKFLANRVEAPRIALYFFLM